MNPNADSHLECRLAEAYRKACLAELEALKPGNVHIFSDGHGMVVQDFLRSAEVSADAIACEGLSVGQRIAEAIEATWQAVGCNTNLGIVLLAAPMLQTAWERGMPICQADIAMTLQSLTVKDAALAYQAIRRATPGGLGRSGEHDVHEAPQVTLSEAMRAAADRDMIARQYTNDFNDIFSFGTSWYEAALQRWERAAWATTALYLAFLSTYPDSHIQRKFGYAKAEEIRAEAAQHAAVFSGLENPKTYQRALMDFDVSLKRRGINPGTSADLTVATLLARNLSGTNWAASSVAIVN